MTAVTGFVRKTHERCEDCDVREDLHASGKPLPKRRHRIASCQTCAGRGEVSLGRKDGLDPYRTRPKPGREEFYAGRRELRAGRERHRFRPKTRLFEECELLMQIPPGGFNHGRAKNEDGGWSPLESQGQDGDILWPPSFKRVPVPLKHGTRYAYQKAKCRCFMCRRWSALNRQSQRVATSMGRGTISALDTKANGAFPVESNGLSAA